MSTVDEIENAIKSLSADERAQLAESLPKLIPELDGDAEWNRIINDPTPRPKLTKFLDEIDARLSENPEQFTELTEEEFDKHERSRSARRNSGSCTTLSRGESKRPPARRIESLVRIRRTRV